MSKYKSPELHDEILDVLRDVSQALHKQVDGPAVVRPSEIDKFARLYELVNDVDTLINRIEGEEAE